MSKEILEIEDDYTTDESIEKYEYHEYTPVTGTNNLSYGNEIRLVVETQDLFLHPSESYLIVEGSLLQKDGNRYKEEDQIALVNNGIMHLFEYIKYELSGQEIERVNNVGQATTMLGLLKYSTDFSQSQGMNQCWMKEILGDKILYGMKYRKDYLLDSEPKGSFSFKIPLKHIFGFCEDYNKIVYGFKHQLTLYRKSNDNDAIERDGTKSTEGKIHLDKISWFIPHILPNDSEKLKLYKIIENKKKLNIAYRMRQCDTISVSQSTQFDWRLSVKSSPEKPRYIIIGFQTDKKNKQTKSPSTFDHNNLKNIYVTLNSRRYPDVDYNISFDKNHISRIYGEAVEFRNKYYGLDELMSNLNIMPHEFKENYPLFVFDVSKQSERLKNTTIDVLVKAQFEKNVPANTEAFAVVISDKTLIFQSDGNKMSVI